MRTFRVRASSLLSWPDWAHKQNQQLICQWKVIQCCFSALNEKFPRLTPFVTWNLPQPHSSTTQVPSVFIFSQTDNQGGKKPHFSLPFTLFYQVIFPNTELKEKYLQLKLFSFFCLQIRNVGEAAVLQLQTVRWGITIKGKECVSIRKHGKPLG